MPGRSNGRGQTKKVVQQIRVDYARLLWQACCLEEKL